jgi:hypothetical protein
MTIILVEKSIERDELHELAKLRYGDLVKAVVDIEKGIMSVGGELHVDEEAFLLDSGSRQQDLWGINIYPQKSGDGFIEFDSVINLRPRQENFTRGVDNPVICQKIKEIVQRLVLGYDKILS